MKDGRKKIDSFFMCLTKPVQIISIDSETAEIMDDHGALRTIIVAAVQDVQVGDWVLVNANLAVQKINEKEALELKELVKLMDSNQLIS